MAKAVGFARSTGVVLGLAVATEILAGCGGQQGLSSSSTDNSVTDATTFLDEHNQFRAQVVQPANYPGVWSPLPPMVWSESVAATAQIWAEELRDKHGCVASHDDNVNLGQNLAYGFVGYSAKQAVDDWAAEKDAPGFTFAPVYQFNAATGHYSQIVWRSSTQLGCNTTRCTGSAQGYVLHVCFYSPAGNVDGQQPY